MNTESQFYVDELTVERPEGLYGVEATITVECEWKLEDVSPYCECGRNRCYHTKTESVLEVAELVELNIKSAWLMPRLPDGELSKEVVDVPVSSVVGVVLTDLEAAALEYAEDCAEDNAPTERDFEDAAFDPPY